MSRPPRADRWLFALPLVALSFAVASLAALEPSPEAATSLRFRRVFVPEEELAAQARGLIPMRREEFDQRIAAATEGLSISSAPNARITEATYGARLEEGQFVEGWSRLQVDSSSPSAVVLSLEPCNLALGKGAWEAPQTRSARMGTTPGGVLALLVEQSGRLAVPWSLRGSKLDDRELTFDIRLPRAAVNRLVLQTPMGKVLKADAGVVSRLAVGAKEAQALVEPNRPDSLNWLVELGGHSVVRLQVNDAANAGQRRDDLVLVREAVTHLVSPADVTTDFSLQLDVHQTALSQLRLTVDAGTPISSVRLSGQPLRFQVLPGGDQRDQLLVELPEPFVGTGLPLSITAVAPLALGQTWKLPRVQVAEGVWQEGTATVIVPGSLRLQVSRLQEAQQVAHSSASAAQPDEAYQFQYHSTSGVVEAQMTKPVPRLKVAAGLVVRHEATQLTGLFQADLLVESGHCFDVKATLANRWVVDSIESVPADLLEERKFIQQGQQVLLHLRLTRSLSEQKSVRLLVRAHHPLPPQNESISADSLRLLEFHDVAQEQLLMALRPGDPAWEFQLAQDLDLARLDPEAASADEFSLLDASPAGVLFRFNRQAESLQISLRANDARFSASMEGEALVYRDRIEHRAVARITPSSSSMGRLVIRASPAPPAATHWRITAPADLSVVSQTLLPSDAGTAPGDPREAIWELLLSRPVAQQFSIEAAWDSAFADAPLGLPVFSFPEATAQEGHLLVGVADTTPVTIHTEQVKSVPVPLPSGGQHATQRGLFRYEPGRRATIEIRRPRQKDRLAPAWVVSSSLESQFAPDGSGTHELVYRLENTGLERFSFRLPQSARLEAASLGPDGLPVIPARGENGSQTVPLPKGLRFPIVKLIVSTPASARQFTLLGDWEAPQVITDLTTLRREWHVHLPASYLPLQTSPEAASARWYDLWKERLWSVAGAGHRTSLAELRDFTRPLPEAGPIRIQVYSPVLWQTWGIVLAILAAASVFWLAARRSLILLFTCTFASVAALLLPLPFALWAAGIFWGTVCGAGLGLLRPQSRGMQPASPASVPSTAVIAGIGAASALLAWLLVLVHQSPSAAAPPEGAAGAQPGKAHRVVIPVDAEQKPSGEYVFVSLEFYELLYRTPESRDRSPAWLLRLAEYELQAAEEAGEGGEVVVAELEVETLVPKARISLPLQRAQVHLLPGRATLDGESLPLNWDDRGTSLQAEIARPGVYQLVLAFSVAARPDAGGAETRLDIPRLARAQLKVPASGQDTAWEFPTAQGAVLHSAANSATTVDIGPASELAIRRSGGSAPAASLMEGEQLVWWKVQPGSVVGECLVRIRPTSGKLNEFALAVDPRLRLLPREKDLPVRQVWSPGSEHRIYHFPLAEPTDKEAELRVRFLLPDASGVGKLVLPDIKVQSDRITRVWHAFTLAKNLELASPLGDDVSPLSPADFGLAWGQPGPAPTFAFEPRARKQAAFVVRPRGALAHGPEAVDLSFGPKHVDVRYRADLVGLDPHRFDEVIVLPPNMEVSRVSLQEGETSVPHRWLRNDDGTITLQRLASPGATQRLTLNGAIASSPSPARPIAIPLPGLRNFATDASTVRVYRAPAAGIQIADHPGLTPSPTPAGAPWDLDLGRLVASFQGAGGVAEAPRTLHVAVKSNPLQAAYRLVTQMESTAGRAWSAHVNCQVDVLEGELDALRFEIPPEWSGPFELSPAMEHQVILIPGQTRRQLVIRPADAVTTAVRFTIRGPVKLEGGETPRPPDLIPLDAAKSEAIVILPSRAIEQKLEWQTSGLQAIPLAEVFQDQAAPIDCEAFRVVAPRFEAALRKSTHETSQARIVHADVQLLSAGDSAYSARATYYLIPGSQTEAQLVLPAETRLIQVLVNETSAQARVMEDGKWSLGLGPEQLPQKIEVLYEGKTRVTALSERQYVYSAPHWNGISLPMTNWVLDEGPQVRKFSPARALALHPARPHLDRMNSVIRIVRDAGDSGSAALPARQLAAWLSLWRAEFAAALEDAQSATEQAPSPDRDLETERKSLAAEFDATLTRFADLKTASEPPSKGDQELRAASDRPRLALSQTGAAAVALTVRDEAADSHSQRLGLTIVILALAAGLFQLHRRDKIRGWFSSSPLFVLVLTGLLLVPLAPFGFWGLLPVIASILLAFRHPWRLANPERPSSNVPRGAQ